MIHPTAIIEDGARIAADCRIGPYCVLGPQVVLQHLANAERAFRLMLDVRERGLVCRATRREPTQRRHALSKAVDVLVDLLVVRFEEVVQVAKLRPFHQPVMLLILMKQRPHGSLDGIELRQQLLHDLVLQANGVVLNRVWRTPGRAVCRLAIGLGGGRGAVRVRVVIRRCVGLRLRFGMGVGLRRCAHTILEIGWGNQ